MAFTIPTHRRFPVFVSRLAPREKEDPMKNVYLCVSTGVLMASVAYTSAAASAAVDYSSTLNKFKTSPQVQPLFKDAYGYAVYPSVGKGCS